MEKRDKIFRKYSIGCIICKKIRQVSYFQNWKHERTPLKCKKCASSENGFRKGQSTWSKGKIFSIEYKNKLSLAHLGQIAWNKGLKGYKEKEQHYNWKGGVTPQNNKIRTSTEYNQWRKQVFERDNWTCQKCFIRGGNLEADHIKEFAKYPELRMNLSNGRTLCVKCHRQRHQLQEVIYPIF